jgi:acetyl esterase/lipase
MPSDPPKNHTRSASAQRGRRPRHERRTLVYKTTRACEIRADLYRPVSDARVPLVFWIHGGGLVGGSRRDLLPGHRNAYLSLGLAVLAIDYRLAPETHLPLILGDVREAYKWAATFGADDWGIDPARIALVGHSGGAYLAFCIAETVRPRPRALVSFSGYGDILGDWYLRPNPLHLRSPLVPNELARDGLGHGEVSEADGEERWRFYRYCRQRGTWPWEVSGLDPLAGHDALEAYCPVRHVSSSFPPALFLHGDADKDVPYQESTAMVDALLAVGVDAELITVPRCGHMFEQGGTTQAREAFARVVEFLRTRLRVI